MIELLFEGLLHLIALLLTLACEGLERFFAWVNKSGQEPPASSEPAPRRRAGAPAGFGPTLRGHGQRCPYCHDDLGGALMACEGCGTALHAECARELRRCTTIGCGGQSELPADARSFELHLRPRSGARVQVQARRRSA